MRPLVTQADFERTLALLAALHAPIDIGTLRMRLAALQDAGWQGIGVFRATDGALVALAGCHVRLCLAYGHCLCVDHFVVTAAMRGVGVGSDLLAHLAQMARRRGCARLMLDAALTDGAAPGFWSRRGFSASGLQFAMALPAP